ncbi:MAG: Rnase Y domain-containing protein, partial [Desulfocapsaceae bacterium]|nr:Rnase Y domain-containing protein [Desulfocapsaceae bacterium]
MLHSKEVVYQLKQAVEEEIRADKDDLKDERRQLSEKKEQLKREAEGLGKRQADIQQVEANLRQQEEGLQKKNNDVEQLLLRQRNELEKIAGIGREEAKKLLMDSMESEARMHAAKKLARIESEMKMEADKKGKNILALAISRYAGDYVADKTVSMVPLPNDEMKGRIIGREGRNIRAIEAATGIDIIIDDTPEAVILSGFNPVRREVARLALLQLINDGRIHPARIEEVVAKVTKEL